jgi:hypothetical protein
VIQYFWIINLFLLIIFLTYCYYYCFREVLRLNEALFAGLPVLGTTDRGFSFHPDHYYQYLSLTTSGRNITTNSSVVVANPIVEDLNGYGDLEMYNTTHGSVPSIAVASIFPYTNGSNNYSRLPVAEDNVVDIGVVGRNNVYATNTGINNNIHDSNEKSAYI